MTHDNRTVIIKECHINAETDKAIKLTAYLKNDIDNTYENGDNLAVLNKWIPKSNIIFTKEEIGYTVSIPRWLLQKHLERISNEY